LIKYDEACRAIAECMSIDEVKDISDKAEAMRVYAIQAKNRQLEIDAAEIRMWAERRLGELLIKAKEFGHLREGRPSKNGYTPVTVSLKDLEIDKRLSMRAQKLAAIPINEFKEMLEEWRDSIEASHERISTRLSIDQVSRKTQRKSNAEHKAQYSHAVRDFLAATKQYLKEVKEARLRIKSFSPEGRAFAIRRIENVERELKALREELSK
jgi:hypothetical protein